MTLHRRTWLAIAVAAAGFALVNLHCWRPGTGGRTDGPGGVRPGGSEVELYYGWPACYRAELVRSDDPGLADRVLRTAPFHAPPHAAGWVAARYFGWLAAAVDATFALLATALVALIVECDRRGRWTRLAFAATLVLGALLAAGYWVADAVDVHL
jgi:hypothetical protein